MGVVLWERRGAVAVITLNRPEVRNAIDPEMACRLVEAYARAAEDPEVRVLVVTGAGPAFCSGGDLEKSLPLLTGARQPQDEFERRVAADPDLLVRAALRDALDKPVIAAVNGHCLAGGTELLLGTDIRIAAEEAVFGLPEVRHALVPFAGALSRLPHQVPLCAAMEMMLVGDPLPAADALRLGLVNRVVPAHAVLPHALQVAERIAGNGPLAVREIKRTVRASLGRSEEEAFRLEDAARERVMSSADAREGPAAFLEKRPPAYRGA
ncbi:enoyl-CoA hydratase/isomerase family protein [Azospirillum sp. ST 5-10]|uniref:enoyl-CoA hydratase/isomerase family protein n=1 Tax=unclassified Azospirillum TaxID=2630922 RepID=UPI003F4A1A11